MKARALVAITCILLFGACTESERAAIGGTDENTAQETDAHTAAVDDDAEERPTTTRPEREEERELEVDAGFTSTVDMFDTRNTSVGALVTNPNATYAAYDVTAVFNLVAADGTILDTESADVPYIPAASTVPVAPAILGFGVSGEPASVEVQLAGDVRDDRGWDGVEYSIYDGFELTVSDPGIAHSEYSTDLAFTITNPTDKVVDWVSWTCVLRKGGAIVGGESSVTTDPIVPGGTIRADTYLMVDTIAADEFICRAYV